ncbi:CPBP family intramembrane glutamic endopeptidase [Streptomyces botrytidirepellens]|uniref:CPBP family intramembrane metalloprotease n=1 Tax=Streptomyces botrytidirepellens TaxID=2486417 RepID=A0A3M8SBS2_9ACTN|nr:CPBP family intramembrane glutamic endopeptidase [Streptomyces botrytidirepellens]RNF78707.1 CPBP family intramembrane metalloprotease [Streptomyces botrytidirepellens]
MRVDVIENQRDGGVPRPVLRAAVTLALAAALGLWRPDLAPLDEIADGVPGWAAVLALPLLTPVYWGEEFGWTSYLRPRLFGGRMAPSAIVTGLIWASWHYPPAFIGYIEYPRLFLGLLVWTLCFQFQEVILAWLFMRSGTIWTASLAHAGNNLVLFLLTGQLLSSGDDGLGTVGVTLLTMIPLAGLSLWIARLPNRGVA